MILFNPNLFIQDELMEHDTIVILKSQQFRHCLTQQKLFGTRMFKMTDVLIRRIKKLNYVSLKRLHTHESENPSANEALRRLLGEK